MINYVKPLADRVTILLAENVKKENVTFEITSLDNANCQFGHVAGVGIGTPSVTMEVKDGDFVAVAKGAGLALHKDNVDVLIVKHSDIICILNE